MVQGLLAAMDEQVADGECGYHRHHRLYAPFGERRCAQAHREPEDHTECRL
jgi:hypothetical protein